MAAVERWLLPDGIEEVLPAQAARIEVARRQVLDLFAAWGYEYVVTPHVEFLDSLLTGVGKELALRTFSVTDPLSGQLMGLRADITPQVARLDAHSLRREGPSRLCYTGSVVHTRARDLSHSRSPIQIGAELFGERGTCADIEIISLMLHSIEQLGVDKVHLDLGHVGVYRGLAKAAGIDAKLEEQLFDALQRKAVSEIGELTRDIPDELAGLLKAICGLCGGYEVLEQAQQVLQAAPRSVRDALAELEQVARVLRERFPGLSVYFDLSELRGYNYHTGLVFAAFVPGVGQAIAQGGRYDDIGQVFGRSRPATGFSADLKTLIGLGQIRVADAGAIWAPASNEHGLWQKIQQLRASGERVVQALGEQGLADAQAAGCQRQLVFDNDSWQLEQISI